VAPLTTEERSRLLHVYYTRDPRRLSAEVTDAKSVMTAGAHGQPKLPPRGTWLAATVTTAADGPMPVNVGSLPITTLEELQRVLALCNLPCPPHIVRRHVPHYFAPKPQRAGSGGGRVLSASEYLSIAEDIKGACEAERHGVELLRVALGDEEGGVASPSRARGHMLAEELFLAGTGAARTDGRSGTASQHGGADGNSDNDDDDDDGANAHDSHAQHHSLLFSPRDPAQHRDEAARLAVVAGFLIRAWLVADATLRGLKPLGKQASFRTSASASASLTSGPRVAAGGVTASVGRTRRTSNHAEISSAIGAGLLPSAEVGGPVVRAGSPLANLLDCVPIPASVDALRISTAGVEMALIPIDPLIQLLEQEGSASGAGAVSRTRAVHDLLHNCPRKAFAVEDVSASLERCGFELPESTFDLLATLFGRRQATPQNLRNSFDFTRSSLPGNSEHCGGLLMSTELDASMEILTAATAFVETVTLKDLALALAENLGEDTPDSASGLDEDAEALGLDDIIHRAIRAVPLDLTYIFSQRNLPRWDYVDSATDDDGEEERESGSSKPPALSSSSPGDATFTNGDTGHVQPNHTAASPARSPRSHGQSTAGSDGAFASDVPVTRTPSSIAMGSPRKSSTSITAAPPLETPTPPERLHGATTVGVVESQSVSVSGAASVAGGVLRASTFASPALKSTQQSGVFGRSASSASSHTRAQRKHQLKSQILANKVAAVSVASHRPRHHHGGAGGGIGARRGSISSTAKDYVARFDVCDMNYKDFALAPKLRQRPDDTPQFVRCPSADCRFLRSFEKVYRLDEDHPQRAVTRASRLRTECVRQRVDASATGMAKKDSPPRKQRQVATESNTNNRTTTTTPLACTTDSAGRTSAVSSSRHVTIPHHATSTKGASSQAQQPAAAFTHQQYYVRSLLPQVPTGFGSRQFAPSVWRPSVNATDLRDSVRRAITQLQDDREKRG
jgi:hypothetical protein